ncbi:U5 small nuclear ribonucleoprotein 40 kDa protein (U5 snRNP 40 kDa protein) (WD repeat-containing protein 57) [Durusdinium trenchii]|uniref:U5 small nuclear ribonucleoprotein 40 kDa protein (U5 snRNP 40 kDa protein) (WD repeat-containing protein 57) n=1 Tax=Durusdinium trenchii TaxID=1381693 RepID=A0ABP0QJP6_9DINO
MSAIHSYRRGWGNLLALSGLHEGLDKSFEKGVPPSCLEGLLETMLIRAEGCEEDVDTGVNFVLMAAEDELQDFRCQDERNWETISAAASEHVPAQLKLGEMLLKGEGVKRNETLAARYFMLAAKEGSVQAADQGNEEAGQLVQKRHSFASFLLEPEYVYVVCTADTDCELQQPSCGAGAEASQEDEDELGVMYLCGEGTMSDEERRRKPRGKSIAAVLSLSYAQWLVPALQEQLIHVQHVNRKSGLFGPTMLLTGHEGEVFCAEFSPDGRSLATGSFDKCLYLWNVYGECENYGVMKGHANAVLEVHWKHDGTQLYTCSADKSVCVWDPESGKRLKKLNGHTAIVNSMQTSRRGVPYLVSGGDDGTTKLWDLRVRRCVHTFEHQYQILAVSFDDTAERIFSGSLDNTVLIYDMRMRDQDPEVLEGHGDSITGLDVSKDGNFLATNSMDNTVCIWDVRPFAGQRNRCLRIMRGATHNFEKNLLRVRWSEKDALLAAGSACQNVNIWDMKMLQLAYRLPGHTGSVNEVCFHPKEPIIASVASDRMVFMGELGD